MALASARRFLPACIGTSKIPYWKIAIALKSYADQAAPSGERTPLTVLSTLLQRPQRKLRACWQQLAAGRKRKALADCATAAKSARILATVSTARGFAATGSLPRM